MRIINTGSIKKSQFNEGLNIETKVARMVSNEEPITDSVPLFYGSAKDGVRPEYNVRTDRFQIAMEAHEKISSYEKSQYLKRVNGVEESPAETKEVD